MSVAAEATGTAADDGKIVCLLDQARVHAIQVHLARNHPGVSLDDYKAKFPGAPTLSAYAKQRLAEHDAKKKAELSINGVVNVRRAMMHEVFGLGNVKAAMSSMGNPIEITVIEGNDEEALPYMAEVDNDYVFNIDLVKKILVGLEMRKPIYLWGMHGTGKTTALEQVMARTNRPFMRVQHTVDTESSHILGQYVVRTKIVEEEVSLGDGTTKTIQKPHTVTEFQLGPLPMAMLFGFVYCADEYDFALPAVVSVYQPVLEGKALVIKEAPPEFRVIKPHPNFRFAATGNTNGVGDETGLYQGTMIQNAANYSRFPVTEEVTYMEPKIEESVLISKTGIDKANAAKIVKFAGQIRVAFADGKISMTISPRELINAADLAIAFGGDWMLGLKLSFANRLSRVDKATVEAFMQRIFGS